ncbi:MAG: hypothetical protein ACFFDN_10705 [Candidatus Hodarchaeota archaeon]
MQICRIFLNLSDFVDITWIIWFISIISMFIIVILIYFEEKEIGTPLGTFFVWYMLTGVITSIFPILAKPSSAIQAFMVIPFFWPLCVLGMPILVWLLEYPHNSVSLDKYLLIYGMVLIPQFSSFILIERERIYRFIHGRFSKNSMD